jgi:hypothetical protein
MEKIAVLLLGYKRTENISQRLLELTLNKRVPIIVSIDGGIDAKDIQEIRGTLRRFDNHGEGIVQKTIFRETNLGLAKHLQVALTEVLSEFEYCIVIEDDISISKTFISNFLESTSYLRRDDVLTIGGFSPFIPYSQRRFSTNTFRESKYFSAWGWMISREKWTQYELELKSHDYENQLSKSKTWRKLSGPKKEIWRRRFLKVSIENPPTWDYQMQYLTFKRDQLNIVPVYKICQNLGFDDLRSTHTTGRRPNWMKEHLVLPDEQLQIANLIEISSIRGKLLNFIDSIYVAGDSRLVKTYERLRRITQFKTRDNS